MLTNMIKTATLSGLCIGLLACAEVTTSNPCGNGEAVAVNGATYCVYKEAIVIVGGFECPASMRFRMDFQNATVCSDHAFDNIDVPNDICARAFVPCTEVEDSDAGADAATRADSAYPTDSGACPVDFGDCDADPANGCETALNTKDNCGACALVCAETCGRTVDGNTCLATRQE